MGKNNNKIELSEEEAVKVIGYLHRIVGLPGNIKSHFAEEKDIPKYNKMPNDHYYNE